MVTLKNAAEAVETDLRVLQNEGHSMIVPLGLISGVLSSIPEGGDAPVRAAKTVCEVILDRAHEAEDADLSDVAERLLGCVRLLSPIVAGLVRLS